MGARDVVALGTKVRWRCFAQESLAIFQFQPGCCLHYLLLILLAGVHRGHFQEGSGCRGDGELAASKGSPSTPQDGGPLEVLTPNPGMKDEEKVLEGVGRENKYRLVE